MRSLLIIFCFLLSAGHVWPRVDTQSSTDVDTFCSGPVDKELCFDKDGNFVPTTDNNQDLGTSSLEFKNLYIDGTANIDVLTIDESMTVGGTTFTITSGMVGIGTTTPNQMLTVSGVASPRINISGNAAGSPGINFSQGSTNRAFVFYDGANGVLTLSRTGGTETGIKINASDNLVVGLNGTPLAIISTGTYTPVCSDNINLDSCTPGVANFTRIGNMVMVSGNIAIDPAAASDTQTTFELSLPISSDLALATDVAGANSFSINQRGFIINCDTVANTAQFNGRAEVSSGLTASYFYQYVIK